jgi:hypothetical protein
VPARDGADIFVCKISMSVLPTPREPQEFTFATSSLTARTLSWGLVTVPPGLAGANPVDADKPAQ